MGGGGTSVVKWFDSGRHFYLEGKVKGNEHDVFWCKKSDEDFVNFQMGGGPTSRPVRSGGSTLKENESIEVPPPLLSWRKRKWTKYCGTFTSPIQWTI